MTRAGGSSAAQDGVESRRLLALTLARKHPGWGCRRISAAMRERHGVSVSKSVIAEWIREVGLAPANRRLRPGDWPRRKAVTGTCGHPCAPPPVDDPTRRVLCFQCGWVDVRRGEQRALVEDARVRERKLPAPPAPDTAPTAGEGQLHFVDRRASTVARDLLDRLRYGTSSTALARGELRRLGWADAEIDAVLGASRRSRRR